ncbi:MAG: proline dehydrogenase family protein [Myxococcota bacterium]
MNSLIRLIPPGLVRLFAKPYVAGDSLERALDVAASLWHERRLLTTLDLLAEDIDSTSQVEGNIATYCDMIDRVAQDSRFADITCQPTISLKLSSYTTAPLEEGGDAAGSREAALHIAAYAKERGVRLTIDMEGHPWTDFTLETLAELHAAGHHHVGGVMQSRLLRSPKDIEQLPPKMRMRLVIGIYDEPQSIALTDKEKMKEQLLVLAERLLRRGHYVEFGSHDTLWVRRFVNEVVPRCGVGVDRFEVQMLYGVPRDALVRELQSAGIKVRLYVPFALSWSMAIAYLRRRLDEYPAMMFLVAKNLFDK